MWHIYVDTGGTFTDCLAISPDGSRQRLKVLSSARLRMDAQEISGRLWQLVRPLACNPGLLRGFRATLGDGTHRRLWVERYEPFTGTIEFNADPRLESDTAVLELSAPYPAPVLAALLATGAENRENAPPFTLYLATTRATNALLERKGAKTGLIVTHGFEDMLAIGTQQRPDLFSLEIKKAQPLESVIFGLDERLDGNGEVLRKLDETDVLKVALQIRNAGVEAVCVSLMHSVSNSAHEAKTAEMLRKTGLQYVIESHDVVPFAHYLKRTWTALTEAYLTPVFRRYLDEIGECVPAGRFYVIDSTGGRKAVQDIRAVDALVSGPAAGVIAAIHEAKKAGFQRVITFDMGGTSTDVARFDGTIDLKYEQSVSDMALSVPSMAIETVAAGGGSIVSVKEGLIKVGPESAGADPGPACYGRGGPLTLTDVNLLLGRIRASDFSIPVSEKAAEKAFEKVFPGLPKEKRASTLLGIIQIADEKMAEAIRTITIRKGVEPSGFTLTAYGGAGGIHACAVASHLNIKSVYFPANAGIFSASGIEQTSLQEERTVVIEQPYMFCGHQLPRLIKKHSEELSVAFQHPQVEVRFGLRLPGQQGVVEVITSVAEQLPALFEQRFRETYGYGPGASDPEVVWMRLFVKERLPEPKRTVSFEKEVSTHSEAPDRIVYKARGTLLAGEHFYGPAVIGDAFATVYVEKGWQAVVGTDGSILAEKASDAVTPLPVEMEDALSLELFMNRFRGIVTEMGEQLQRTSMSVNVKERLDFSCALFDPEGRLVANAPHIPVHLGALGPCVRALAKFGPGEDDVLLTNHPGFGGSHLPDITLVAPVFDVEKKLLGYVATRAHHAELGGRTPGSMPADATKLEEEGVIFEPFFVVKKGVFQHQELMERLHNARFPSRNVRENEADILAALASLRLGGERLKALAAQCGTSKLLERMDALRHHSKKLALQALLQAVPDAGLSATGRLDDGTPLCVRISRKDEQIHIDFSGTGPQHPGNLNANPAIVASVVLYVIRLLIQKDIPLNEGILEAVLITIPAGSILSPDFTNPEALPAVVGGNTETSQKLAAVLINALNLQAGGQSTMNNVLFGNNRFGYYETIGGGSGAGPGFHGAAGIHTHMTNTALTDAEILERRYPVRVWEHSIRKGSGGGGRWRGGEGVRRVLEFLEPLTVSVLAESRIEAPFGKCGGGAGATGSQTLISPVDGVKLMPSNFSVEVAAGTKLILETPGGGGWGSA